MPRQKHNKQDFHSPIKDLFQVGNDYKGEVGIEIEVEGRNLIEAPPSYWNAVKDGSLRGESKEYVLRQPCQRGTVLKLLQYLVGRLEKNEAKIVPSVRTSVHIHVNMGGKTLIQAYNYMLLYYLVEDLMSHIAGEDRVGNVFCLRARDAEEIVDFLAEAARTRRFAPDPEKFRYASVNFCALTKFNSIEFRALRGTVDPAVIAPWVQLLLAIKDAALEYKDPAEILADFSRLGAKNLVRKIFGDFEGLFTGQKGWENSIWENARLVQEIAYATNWAEVVEVPKRFFVVDDQQPAPVRQRERGWGDDE